MSSQASLSRQGPPFAPFSTLWSRAAQLNGPGLTLIHRRKHLLENYVAFKKPEIEDKKSQLIVGHPVAGWSESEPEPPTHPSLQRGSPEILTASLIPPTWPHKELTCLAGTRQLGLSENLKF